MKALREVAEQASWYKSILDRVPGFVQVFNNEGRFLDFKPQDEARMWYPREYCIGRLIEEVLPAELCVPRRSFFDAALESGKPQRYNQRFFSNRFKTVRDYNILIEPIGKNQVIVIVRDRLPDESPFPIYFH